MNPSFPVATWRLLFEPHPKPGALNMAIDEAVLRAVVAGEVPPTLRLYGWSPPTLTLGRGQPYADADVTALERDGIALVRRMTGGTAVLNRDELTYSIATTDREPRFSGTVAESYRAISAALLRALQPLGLTTAEATAAAGRGRAHSPTYTAAAAGRQRRERTPVCFEIPSDYEVTVDGRKLVGNSQMRVRGGILQHGSLPLTGDIGAISAYLTARPDPARIRAVALTLQDALGRAVTWLEVAEPLLAAFGEMLNLTLVESPLTQVERRQVERLLAEKYDNPDWNERL